MPKCIKVPKISLDDVKNGQYVYYVNGYGERHFAIKIRDIFLPVFPDSPVNLDYADIESVFEDKKGNCIMTTIFKDVKLEDDDDENNG